MTLETTHLHLTPWSPSHLLALLDSNERFEQLAGYAVAPTLRDLMGSDDVSPEWLAALREAPAADPWVLGFFIAQRDNGLIIGSASFKGPPDSAGIVEIAYGVAPEFEGRGYATEAAAALVTFAFDFNEVELIRAHTLPMSIASQRVLAKCGFIYVGNVDDPDDGIVTRWELARVKKLTNNE